jgi:hypothetical protein
MIVYSALVRRALLIIAGAANAERRRSFRTALGLVVMK